MSRKCSLVKERASRCRVCGSRDGYVENVLAGDGGDKICGLNGTFVLLRFP